MHILHVITSLYPGGAQSALCRLCTNDTANQHTIIAMIGGGDYEERLRQQGIAVESLGFTRKDGLLSGMVRLWKHLRQYRPDLVQTWMYHPDLIGGICARLAGVRHVCWGIRHTALETGQSSRSSIITARLCARLSGLIPNRIVCCAHEAARLHASLGYRSEKMVVIPNGYDLSAFHPFGEPDGRRDDVLSGEDLRWPVLGMVGRYNTQKDHENLLMALAEVKSRGHGFSCLLVGSGLDDQNLFLVKRIAELDLTSRIRLMGIRSDIPVIMNCLDLHILSSSFGEAFPNVIAEAMACGTPCVGTDVGDTAMIIGETGWVVPPKEPCKLADAIQAALVERMDFPDRWAGRQASSVARIKDNFTIDKMVTSFDSVWASCLDSKD
ncbi:glycosyltransferase [Halomonas korlensis]|uniref:Glycosyltransferase involved in cell wall bisynthesis n=1 Tax=Halomonas korlensis TaxID=463301 RepID=A0A1I7FBQ3_9GAMM|nr:glycosyltransferase [Halomonas korlensis]SFU33592.1 Glycosyltransferase involved in cell wall bisynthesis [Halomonas korlensis]